MLGGRLSLRAVSFLTPEAVLLEGRTGCCAGMKLILKMQSNSAWWGNLLFQPQKLVWRNPTRMVHGVAWAHSAV